MTNTTNWADEIKTEIAEIDSALQEWHDKIKQAQLVMDTLRAKRDDLENVLKDPG